PAVRLRRKCSRVRRDSVERRSRDRAGAAVPRRGAARALACERGAEDRTLRAAWRESVGDRHSPPAALLVSAGLPAGHVLGCLDDRRRRRGGVDARLQRPPPSERETYCVRSLAFDSLPWERYAPWLDTAPSSIVVRGNLPVPPQVRPL